MWYGWWSGYREAEMMCCYLNLQAAGQKHKYLCRCLRFADAAQVRVQHGCTAREPASRLDSYFLRATGAHVLCQVWRRVDRHVWHIWNGGASSISQSAFVAFLFAACLHHTRVSERIAIVVFLFAACLQHLRVSERSHQAV